LIIPFSQTLPIVRRIPSISENLMSTLEGNTEKLGRIIDTLADGSMAELQDYWKHEETGQTA
jgi:hypothetical protein